MLIAFCTLGAAIAAAPAKPVPKQITSGSDGSTIAISFSDVDLVIEYQKPELNSEHDAVYLALGTHRDIGSAVLPYARAQEGSTVFLPFKADRLIYAKSASPPSR